VPVSRSDFDGIWCERTIRIFNNPFRNYTIPKKWLTRISVQDIKISLVGRNLALWTENPHVDPETMSMSGGTLIPGVEDMAIPSTRNIGFNVNIKF